MKSTQCTRSNINVTVILISFPTNQGTYSSDSSVADPKPPLMPELHCPERAELLEQFWRDIYFSVRVNCLRGHTYVKVAVTQI